MDFELTGFSLTLIIALIVSIIAVLFIILAIFYCLRRNRSTPYKRAPIVTSPSNSDITKDKNVPHIINIDELNKNDGFENSFDENIRFLGLSFSEIPFIDESRATSLIDLSWNPYQLLTEK